MQLSWRDMIRLFILVCRHTHAMLLFLIRVHWVPWTCLEDDAQQNAFLSMPAPWHGEIRFPNALVSLPLWTPLVIPGLINTTCCSDCALHSGPVLLSKDWAARIFLSQLITLKSFSIEWRSSLGWAFCLSARLGRCVIAWCFFAFSCLPRY